MCGPAASNVKPRSISCDTATAIHINDQPSIVRLFEAEFFGDGATNTGAFHEALNMGAALFGEGGQIELISGPSALTSEA